MNRGNNYSEIRDLNAIIEQAMEAIAHADNILRRNADLEEMAMLAEAINDKQETIAAKRDSHQATVKQCEEILAELESREDLLQVQMHLQLSQDRDDAGEIKGIICGCNRRLDGWLRRNLPGLKAMLSGRLGT